MYLQHFGLHSAPFDDRPDPSFFFSAPDRDEALAAMECALRHGGGAMWLLGESGTGKTMLLRTFLRRLEPNDRAVVIPCPPGGSVDLMGELATGLGMSALGNLSRVEKAATCAGPDRPVEVASRQVGNGVGRNRASRRQQDIVRKLQKTKAAGGRTIIIVDQAENLSHDGLLHLTAVIDLCEGTGEGLAVIVAAQPQMEAALGSGDMARLRQALFSRRIIRALPAKATNDYVRHRLRAAGATGGDCFESAAVELIHAHTGGLPRLINKVCDAAMIAAYGADEDCVRAAVLEELIRGDAPRVGVERESRDSSPAQSSAITDAQIGSSSAVASCSGVSTDAALSGVRKVTLEPTVSFEVISAEHSEREIRLLESRMNRAAAVAAEMERQVERTQRACERAEDLTSKLTAFADQIADRAEDLQSRINLLLGNLSGAALVETRLREAAVQFESAAATAPQRAASVRTDLQGALDRMATETESRVGRVVQEQETRIESFKAMIAACQSVIAKTESDVAKLSARASESCDALERRAERSVRSAGEQMESILDSMQKRQETMRERQMELGERQQAAEAALTVTQADVERTTKRASDLSGQMAQLERVAERVAAIAADSNEGILAKLAEAESLTAKSDKAHERAAELQARVSAILVEVGAGCERVNEARERVLECQAVAERLNVNTERAALVAETLLQRLEAAESDRAELHAAVRQATATGEVLEQRSRVASEVAVRVESATVDARGATEVAHAAAASAKNAGETADLAAKQLNAATVASGKVLGQAAAQVDAAKKTQLALSEMMLGADDKLARLASHQAAASQALERVAEATRTAHAAISEIRAVASDAERAAETGRELGQLQVEAAETLTRLDSAVNLGNDTATGLQGRIAQSIESAGALQLGCQQVGQSLERIERAAEGARRAEVVRDDLVELLSRSDQQHQQLVDASHRGAEVVDRVAEMLSAARDIIETYQRTTHDADHAAERVAEQIERLHESEPILVEIAGRVATLSTDSAVWEARMSDITEKLTSMSEEPRQMLDSARAQTAELERVLAAVRKIFSGLSQASLEAKKHADTLDATGRTTAERLTQLAGSAEKATQMLSQWVVEAVHVQNRLAALVAAAPGIGETHPSGLLRDLAESLATAGQTSAQKPPAAAAGTGPASKPPAPSNQQVRTQPRAPRVLPARTVPTKSVPLRPDVHRRNAEEIAAILEDARRAAEEA